MPILEAHDIHTYYGDSYILQGVSLTLDEGQTLGVLGRNGVGKTTLVNSITGVTPPRRGTVRFKGVDITHAAPFEIVRMGIGLVPQGRRVFGSLSVAENLKVAQNLKGAQSSNGRKSWTVERVMGLFGRLRERRNQRANTLSGGEQQMLAIGRGLMTNPQCLIMDEPTEGLAPLIVQQVWDVIRLLKGEGLSILLVEQNVSVALKLADHVCVLSKGCVVHSSAPQELERNEAVKSQYLGV